MRDNSGSYYSIENTSIYRNTRIGEQVELGEQVSLEHSRILIWDGPIMGIYLMGS